MPLTLRRADDALTWDELDNNFAHEINQTSHGFSVGDLVYRDSATSWATAQANAESTLADGVVVDVEDANNCSVLTLSGQQFTYTSHGLGATGTTVYLSAAAAGDFTATAPTSGFVQPVGKVIDTNTILFRLGYTAEEA